jgi:KDO2-lipid IV(A) lauroyltransferase
MGKKIKIMTLTQNYSEYYAFLIAMHFFKCLPYRFTLCFLRFLFFIFGYCLGIRKKVITSQLKLCFPEKSHADIRRLTKDIYSELAVSVAEIFIFGDRYFVDKVTLTGFDEVEKALAHGRGAMIVSAHLGNWELGAKLIAKRYGTVHGIVKKQRNILFDNYLYKSREKMGVQTYPMSSALKHIIKALNENQVIALLVDQYAHKQAIDIKFLGHETRSYTSVAQLAIKYKVPIIMAFDIRYPDGKHNVIFHPHMIFDTQEYNDENVYNVTMQINEKISEYIVTYPQLWFWVHKKWRKSKKSS